RPAGLHRLACCLPARTPGGPGGPRRSRAERYCTAGRLWGPAALPHVRSPSERGRSGSLRQRREVADARLDAIEPRGEVAARATEVTLELAVVAVHEPRELVAALAEIAPQLSACALALALEMGARG